MTRNPSSFNSRVNLFICLRKPSSIGSTSPLLLACVQMVNNSSTAPLHIKRCCVRSLSVVVEKERTQHLLICKGAVEELLTICTQAKSNGDVVPIDDGLRKQMKRLTRELNEDGLRVIAVAYKETEATQRVYSVKDEIGMTLVGFLAFLDPPKESAAEAISALAQHGVQVKVL